MLRTSYTWEETHMQPEDGPLEDYPPLQPSGFQVPMLIFQGVESISTDSLP